MVGMSMARSVSRWGDDGAHRADWRVRPGRRTLRHRYPRRAAAHGQLLRVYQQYFMVSAGAQLILDELAQRGFAPETLGQHVAILDADDRVHIAHMDIHFTHSTNGVAALHSEILKTSELKPFYDLYPEKFNNKFS